MKNINLISPIIYILTIIIFNTIYINDQINYNELIKNNIKYESPHLGENPICNTIERNNNSNNDPEIVKTCYYRKYKSISIGYPDYKGRYEYEYSVHVMDQNNKFNEIENTQMFNGKSHILLNAINSVLEQSYEEFSSTDETQKCFEEFEFHPFDFNQLGIDFEEDKIIFNATYGLGGACMSVNTTSASFSLQDIQKYMNE